MFTFCWENKFLIGQSTKMVMRSGKSKQNFVKTNIRRSRNFGGLNATYELEVLMASLVIWWNYETCSRLKDLLKSVAFLPRNVQIVLWKDLTLCYFFSLSLKTNFNITIFWQFAPSLVELIKKAWKSILVSVANL